VLPIKTIVNILYNCYTNLSIKTGPKSLKQSLMKNIAEELLLNLIILRKRPLILLNFVNTWSRYGLLMINHISM